MKVAIRVIALVALPFLTLLTSFVFGFFYDVINFGGSWNIQDSSFGLEFGYVPGMVIIGLLPSYIFWILFFLGFTKRKVDILLSVPLLAVGVWKVHYLFSRTDVPLLIVIIFLGFIAGHLISKIASRILRRPIRI